MSVVVTMGALRASRDLHRELAVFCLQAPMAFFDVTPAGRLLNRLSKDIDTIDHMIPNNTRAFLNNFFSILSSFFVVCFVTPLFIVVIVPLFIIYTFLQVLYENARNINLKEVYFTSFFLLTITPAFFIVSSLTTISFNSII